MRLSQLVVFACFLFTASIAPAMQPADVSQAPSCRHCGMDRGKFSQSRMVIGYDDGTRVATCSLHCAAVELANTLDKSPTTLHVADYDSKELLDAEKAVWVMGGNKKGVMTARPKWAFASREAAERFIKANGGALTGFDEAMKAAYDDMYQDTKMIRERRKMMRMKQQGGAMPQ